MADFKFRHGTYDASIFSHVFEQNEYEIASLKGKRLLDIGGHIGSFALKAVSHGADYVVSFEPNQENYDLLFHNVMGFENAEAHRLAITRSDKEVEVRFEAQRQSSEFWRRMQCYWTWRSGSINVIRRCN